jgi:hypothetical protein
MASISEAKCEERARLRLWPSGGDQIDAFEIFQVMSHSSSACNSFRFELDAVVAASEATPPLLSAAWSVGNCVLP